MRHCARKRIIRIFIATTMTALVVASFGVMPVTQAAMVPNFFTDAVAVSTNSGIAAGGGFGSGTNSQTAVSESGVQLGIDTGTGSDGSFTPSLGDVAGGCASAKGMTWSSPTCTIDTNNATYNGQYNFTDVAVTAGTTLTAVGTNYLFLKATGTVTVTGIIDLNGKNGSAFTGGSGGAGGSRGGSGGAGGGGGGGGSLKIVANQITLNTGGIIRANGGSGAGGGGSGGAGGAGEGLGGGGGNPSSEGAAGAGFGAAGGIAIGIAGGATYNILNAGGSGGGSGRSTGGGGSGGGIRLNAITFNNNGIITANGGTIFPNSEAASGGGGGGRIEVTYSSGIAGIITADGGAGTYGANNGQSVVPAFVSFPLLFYYLTGTYDTPSYARDVYVSGNYAYVADYGSSLQIINISNPATPTLTGTYTLSTASDVYVSGNYAYVADSTSSGLKIINISNPATPTLTGTYNTTNALGVYVSGNYAYVADGASGLRIINISNPATPTLTGTYNTTNTASDVYVSGNYAYVADSASGLQIINVSNPATPTLTGTYDTTGTAWDVYVSGNYAYVADYFSGLQIINVSNPATPTLTGTYDTPGIAYEVYVSGNYAYVADGASGLQIINVSNPATPTLIETHDTPGYASDVYVSGNYAYVADESSGLQIIWVITPPSGGYFLSGTFTSAAIDLGAPSSFTTLSWNATLNGQTITVKARSSADGSTWRTNGGAPNSWTNCVNLTSGGALSSGGCVTDGDRYVQYQATLTGDTSATPALNDITINYQHSANYNFSLSASSPADAVAGAASSKISTITAAVQNPQDASINDAVNFSATVSPGGPVISFLPASCVPNSGTCAVDLYASAVTEGNYTVTVRGNNASATYPSGIARTATVALAVLPALDFSLALSLGSGEVIRGYQATSYVDTVLTVGYISGANEIVSITSNAPADITFDPSPTACAPSPGSCTSTIRMNAQSSVAAGNYTFTITGTSAISGGVRTAPFTLRVRDPINYSLSASPPSGAAFQGNSATATITGTYGGYPAGTESVTFASFSSASNPSAFSSVPLAGTISVSFSPSACTLGENQLSCAKSVTISTSSNTTVGDYVITLTGVSSITNTARTMAYAFTVSGPFDFTIAYPSPPCATTSTCSGTVEQASSMNVTVNVSSLSAAGENVAFSVTGLPANTAYSVSSVPNPCVPTASVSCTATLTISPAITASLGTYAVNIVGTSTKQAHSLPFTLTIAQGFTFDVALSASSGVAVRGGSAASAVASISLFSGTGKPVTLSVDGLTGSGVVAGYPGGQSCTPNCQQQITFTAPSSAVLGTYDLFIIGTAGTQTKQAAYTLTVVDPFDFSLNLSSTQGSILAGGNIQTVATLGWLAGGSGADMVSLSSSVMPAPLSGTLTVDFSPSPVAGLTSLNTPLYSTATMTASSDLTMNSYTVVIIAQSGTLIKTKTYNLTVGTTLDFTLTLAPDNERVLQGASSAPIAITAQNTSPENQPADSDISFTIGDTPTYLLPRGVTTTPATLASCALGAAIGSACSSPVVFNVDATGVNGTYLIPIVGTSGFVSRIVYYTLKVGPLNLINYQSPDLMTDAHQRPQASFTWSPPAVFAGDTVQFDVASSTVYVLGQSGFAADTPASDANADFSWSFSGITGGSTLINPQVFYQNSGMRDIALTVTDRAGGCYTSTSSGGEPCACPVSSSSGAPQLEVSKSRPAFREITPQ